MLPRLPRFAALLAGAAALASCAPADSDLLQPVEPLGSFRMGYNIVVAENVQKVEPSRDATPEQWKAAFEKAIDDRFGRYQGDQLYHIAVSVDGYSLAVTGVPLVVTPQSVAIIRATIWDDAAGAKLNAEPNQIVVYERLPGEAIVIGSGATQTMEEQIENIAENGARLIEVWMRENPNWFVAREGASTSVRIRNNQVVAATQ